MNNEYGNLELHKVLLRAMKDIDAVCKENGIKYFLFAGSLLGAINHKGFIPWDDDVDITMFREDYEKFLAIVEEKYSSYYIVHTYRTDPAYPNNRAVLRVRGTEIRHYHENKEIKHNEIAVDIAPLDAVPDQKVLQKIQQGTIWVLDAAVQIKLGVIKPRHPIMKLIGLLSKMNRVTLGRMIDQVTMCFNRWNTEGVGILSATYKNPYTGVSGYYNDIVKRIWHDEPIYLPFEDTQFMTISDPEADLLHRYGPHYMEPYPEEKRITKHDVKEYYIEPWVKERCQ